MYTRQSLLPLCVTLFAAFCSASPANPNTGAGTTPGTWFHEAGHPVYTLFKPTPVNHTIGSPEWTQQFPPSVPDSSKLPSQWVNALNAAVAAGKIPNIPQSHAAGADTQPVYPDGIDPGRPDICSAGEKCRNVEAGDIWDAPEGYFVTSFDDGPLPPTTKLLQFLASEKLVTTHFMVGTNILANPHEFQAIINSGGDLALHTYTHAQMTTLSNLDVVAQIAWSMDIIYQSTGKLPKFWRPPTGDADNRVRAIARELFGLYNVMWNRESDDWRINSDPPQITRESLKATLDGFATGPKNIGPIVLEHDNSDATVQGFIDAYPTLKTQGWKVVPISHLPFNNVRTVATSPLVPKNATSTAKTSVPTGSTGSVTNSTRNAVDARQSPENNAAAHHSISLALLFALCSSIVIIG